MRPTLVDPALTAAASLPQYRFWGSRKPPENKADFFGVTVRAAADEPTSSAETGSVATIRVYGPIDSWGGWWGVSAEEVASVLDGLDSSVSEIRLRINSPGGEVFEGLAILNMLRAHHARVVGVVDGLAASAAGFLAAGCDETVMSPGTQLMIHDARTFVYGPPAVLTKVASVLGSISDSAAELLADVAGSTTDAWRALMEEETWYTATEAVTAGLAQRVAVVPDAGPTETAGDQTPPDSSDFEESFDLSIYAYAGRSQAPAPIAATASTKPPAASAPGFTQKEGKLVDLTDEQIAALREQVGFREDADASTIVQATLEALGERAEETPTTPSGQSQLPAGMTAIPSVALEELRQQAAAGAQAAEQLRVQAREQFLDEHRDRFLPANRDAYRAQYDANPQGTREFLAAAPVIVPLGELGHDVPSAGGEATAKQDDSWFPQYATPTATTQEA